MKNVSVAQKDYSHLFCAPTLCIQSHNPQGNVTHRLGTFLTATFSKREKQIVHFHLISVPIAKGKVDITLTTTKLKVPKEIELPGGRREGLDCIKARSRSQTIPIVSAPHVLKIQILAQNVFAMRVVFLHSSQSILGPGESKPSYEGEKCHECHFCYLPQYQPLSSSFSLFSISTIIFELMTYGRVIWRIMGSAIMDCCESLPCSTSLGSQQRGSSEKIWVSPLLPHLVSSPFGSVALAVSVFIRWWEQWEDFSHAPSHLGWTTRKYGSAKVFSKSVSTTRGSLRWQFSWNSSSGWLRVDFLFGTEIGWTS